MDMESNLYHEHLADLTKSGKVTQAQLDEAVRRVLRVKFALGLFDNRIPRVARKPWRVARGKPATGAHGCGTLFCSAENDFITTRPVLPLASDIQTVALIGPAPMMPPTCWVTGQPAAILWM